MDRPALTKIADRLREAYGAERVLLFGSAARGDAGADSDVDLLIVKATAESFFDRLGTVQRILRPQTRGVAVSPIVLTPAELSARLARGDQFVLASWPREWSFEQGGRVFLP
jgi:predicted nucleotidyltransferase